MWQESYPWYILKHLILTNSCEDRRVASYESSQREDNCILLPHKIKPLSKRTSLAVHEALSLSKWRSFSCHKSLSLHEGRPDNIESKVSF